MTLGDYYQYPIKGVRESNYKLNSRNSMKMKDILYIPGLTKNLLSILDLEKKGFRVAFIDGEVLMWACYRTVCRKGSRQLESRLKTGVTGASPPTVTSMGSSFYLGWLVQGRRPYVIWVLEGLKDNGSR